MSIKYEERMAVKGDRLRDLKRGKERIRLLRRCQEKKGGVGSDTQTV